MVRNTYLMLMIALCVLFGPTGVMAQNEEDAATRKIIKNTIDSYPVNKGYVGVLPLRIGQKKEEVFANLQKYGIGGFTKDEWDYQDVSPVERYRTTTSHVYRIEDYLDFNLDVIYLIFDGSSQNLVYAAVTSAPYKMAGDRGQDILAKYEKLVEALSKIHGSFGMQMRFHQDNVFSEGHHLFECMWVAFNPDKSWDIIEKYSENVPVTKASADHLAYLRNMYGIDALDTSELKTSRRTGCQYRTAWLSSGDEGPVDMSVMLWPLSRDSARINIEAKLKDYKLRKEE